MGGNVRVGLEDSLWLGRGQLAKSNAEQVAKAKRLLEELGLAVATPNDARERIDRAAGRVGHDELDRLGRPGLRVSAEGNEREEN